MSENNNSADEVVPNDEDKPKRRKRAPMFYKVKYLQEGGKIPRDTFWRKREAVFDPTTHPAQNLEVCCL